MFLRVKGFRSFPLPALLSAGAGLGLGGATGRLGMSAGILSLVALTVLAVHERRLVAKAQAQVTERDRILTIIGHDLRGPACSLMSLAHVFAADAEMFTPKELSQLSREISHASALQLELLDSLLAWGRTQAGQRKEPIPLAVSEALAAAWRQLAALADGKNIGLIDASPSGVRVLADPSLLQTILRNLLVNAIKFTHPGGRIEVGGRLLAPGLAEVHVRDEGVGISPERLSRLLDGVVASTPGTREERGAGLGLRLCRDLARAAGGGIRLESAPGRGTTAFVTLPAEEPKAAA